MEPEITDRSATRRDSPRGLERSGAGALGRLLSRHLVPGIVATLYFFIKHRCLVHPRAMVQLTSRIRFGRKTTIHPYSRIRVRGGSVEMGSESTLQAFSTISAGDSAIRIGDYVRIGPNCNLLGENHSFAARDVPIHRQGMISKGLVIEDDVWVGANCVILPGVRVERGSVIGAGSIVTRDVPAFAIVAGNPAQQIGTR